MGTSDDGVTWTAQDSSSTGFIRSHTDATAGAGRFLVCGRDNNTFEGYIITTTDGADWSLGYSTGLDAATRGGIWGVDFVNGIYVACGERGRILFSADGAIWDEKLFAGTPNLRGAAHGAGVYVVVGDNGAVKTSPDGEDWTDRDSGVTSRLTDVAFHAGRFVAVADNSTTMITSTDGIDWDPVDTTTTVFPGRIKVLNGEFVVTGLTSADGVIWEQRSFSGEIAFSGTEYLNYTTAGGIRSASASIQPTISIDSISREGDNISIQWTSGGVLQTRPGVGVGDWSDVNGASNPFQFTNPGGTGEIFRLREE